MCLFSVSCFTHLLFSKFPLETSRLPHLHRAKKIRLGSMDLDSRLMFYYVFELIFERYFKLSKK